MSEFKASGFRDEFGSGGPDLVGITTMTSPYYFVPPSGSTAERPSSPPPGMLRFNTDIGRLEVWRNDHWGAIVGESPNLGISTAAAGSSAAGTGTRGLFAGGYLVSPHPSPGSCTDQVDYITVETLGNALDFGDLADARHVGGQCADRTRAIYAGGRGPTTPGGSDTANITFTTIASTGDYADSGFDLSAAVGARGTSNSTRGLFGSTVFPYTDTIDYVTIQSLGNAQDFGNLTEVRGYGMALSSPVRGVFLGGINNPTNLGTNVIDYVTISSTGNAQNFGDLYDGTAYESGCANSPTRGVIAGGTGNTDLMEFITIATTGNSQNFGDLDTLQNSGKGGTSSYTRGVFAGGLADPAPATVNTIEYITIAATGNALDFGDLQQAKRIANSGVSNGHGGL